MSARGGAGERPLRFAALGDSLTEGVGDPVVTGPRGWAALLAPALTPHPVEFRNLATSGALVHDVAADQTPRALTYRPDLAAVIVGVNDTLRSSFDIGRITADLDQAFQRLSRQGAVLLTACLPDPGRMLRLPAPLARPLARRQRAVNSVVHALSARHDAVHLHLADAGWTADWSLWSADRLHPNERGHRLVAAGFHALLAERGLARGPAPVRAPDQPPPTRAQTLRWLATAGTAWVARRCRDLLPQLLALSATEAAHWARGTGARLDARARQQTTAALAVLPALPALPKPSATPSPPVPSALPRPSAPLGRPLPGP
ncbi:SGNH/GDSL hydrolase family protein [Streptomyces sp. MUM 203J]|nr:SGNH/GDSL hydrolase family protein [Streptomyces sp. MUM 203J]